MSQKTPETEAHFKNPDNIYYGTDFWMLNDKLSEEEMLFQLKEMADKGTKCLLVRTYAGLISDYPGREFKKSMDFVIKNTKKLGLNVFLQAKYMPECIPNIPNKYVMHHITPKNSEDVLTDDNVICEHNGFSFCITSADSILDLFNADAVDYYIKDCYEDMWKDFEAYYGNVIQSIWVDEPAFGRKNPPLPCGFPAIFKETYGYDILPEIYKLWFSEGNYKTVRYHYRILLQKLLEDSYFKRLKKWCAQKKLMVSGHLLGEDRLESQIRLSAACMPYYKYFDIPGMDVLTLHAEWNDTPVRQKPGDELRDSQRLCTTPLQIMSAVNQAGNSSRVLCEMYGASTENMTFRNQMYLFGRLAVFGINHRSIHGIFYSLRGRRKRGYAPHINYCQPYWQKYENMYKYCARTSAFTRFGNPVSDILVLHPLETGYTILNELLPGTASDYGIAGYDAWFYTLLMNLNSAHVRFDLGDFATIRDMGEITACGSFKVGCMEYKTVVLPRLDVLSAHVCSLLKEFSSRGGKIICIGSMPTMLDGYTHDFKDDFDAELVTLSDCIPHIAEHSSGYMLSGTDNAAHIIVKHRKSDSTDYFILMNTDCAHKKSIQLAVGGKKQAKIWNAENGGVTPVYSEFDGKKTVLKTDIDAGASLLVSFEKNNCSVAPILPEKTVSIKLDGGATVKRNTENALLLEYCRYKTEDSEYSCEMPVLLANELLYKKHAVQRIALQFDFYTGCTLSGLKLALEDMENSDIYFNGEQIKAIASGFYIDKSFQKINLPCSKVGKNTITIHKTYIPLSKTSKGLSSIFETSDGTELECMYLLGNFIVKGSSERCLNGCIRMNRNFRLTKEVNHIDGNDLTCEGYPFYAGAAEITKQIRLPFTEMPTHARFKIKCLNAAAAELYVNGKHICDINRGEFSAECTHALKNGENTIMLRLYGTLRNAFGPSHRPIGERGNTFGDTPSRSRGCYGYFDEPWIPMNTDADITEETIDTDTPVWTASYNLIPFGTDGAELVLYYD